jgi:hypothetical protein
MFKHVLKTVDIALEKKSLKSGKIIWCFNNVVGLSNCLEKQNQNTIFFSQFIQQFSTGYQQCF